MTDIEHGHFSVSLAVRDLADPDGNAILFDQF